MYSQYQSAGLECEIRRSLLAAYQPHEYYHLPKISHQNTNERLLIPTAYRHTDHQSVSITLSTQSPLMFYYGI